MSRLAPIALFAAGATGGCAFDTGPVIDADAGVSDAARLDAPPPDGSEREQHLLLSEIKNNRHGQNEDFVEIYNPTGATIDLRDVYLADDPRYPQLAAVVAGNQSVEIGEGDFIARFPSGSVIRPEEVMVVTMRSPFGLGEADFSISGGQGAPMRQAFSGSIAAGPRLESDLGEMVALFFWNGESDRVADVDLMIAGRAPEPGDGLPDKSGLAVEGPDADSDATTYLDDAATLRPQARGIGPVESVQRIALERGAEIAAGGNGLTGHDETSEDTGQTWTIAAPSPGALDEL